MWHLLEAFLSHEGEYKCEKWQITGWWQNQCWTFFSRTIFYIYLSSLLIQRHLSSFFCAYSVHPQFCTSTGQGYTRKPLTLIIIEAQFPLAPLKSLSTCSNQWSFHISKPMHANLASKRRARLYTPSTAWKKLSTIILRMTAEFSAHSWMC